MIQINFNTGTTLDASQLPSILGLDAQTYSEEEIRILVDASVSRTVVLSPYSAMFPVRNLKFTVIDATGNAAANTATISGGRNNATATCSLIAGGNGHNALCYYATIGGGASNSASGCQSTIAGGLCNIASGCFSTVIGGYCNVASGSSSVVVGGVQSTGGCCSCAFIVGGNIAADRCCTTFVNNLSIKGILTSAAGLPA